MRLVLSLRDRVCVVEVCARVCFLEVRGGRSGVEALNDSGEGLRGGGHTSGGKRGGEVWGLRREAGQGGGSMETEHDSLAGVAGAVDSGAVVRDEAA